MPYRPGAHTEPEGRISMRRLYAIALLAVALLTGCTAGGDETLPQLTVTFLSVGKADCILLEADGHAMRTTSWRCSPRRGSSPWTFCC